MYARQGDSVGRCRQAARGHAESINKVVETLVRRPATAEFGTSQHMAGFGSIWAFEYETTSATSKIESALLRVRHVIDVASQEMGVARLLCRPAAAAPFID